MPEITPTRWMDGMEPRRRQLLDLMMDLCMQPDVLDRLERVRVSDNLSPAFIALVTEMLHVCQQIAMEEGQTPAVLIPDPTLTGSHHHG